MKQTAYLNGQFLPIEEAQISTQDRGFLFGDGVYEVIPVYGKKLFEFEAHLERLQNSLNATSISNPLTSQEWRNLLQQLINQHPWQDQFIYLQVTRGVQMQRDHLPADCLTPTVYAYTNPLKPVSDEIKSNGIKVITLEDIRWLRCDIKAITLLPNVMMKLAAKHQQADDAILIDRDGKVAEGTASNVFIVQNGQLITPPDSHKILPGITRMVIEKIALSTHIPITKKEISFADLESADEIWLSSSTKEALPVCQLNNQKVGDGVPGPLWKKMQHQFEDVKQNLIKHSQTET